MKKYFTLTVCMLFLSSVFAAESKMEKLPTISAEVEVSKFVGATECYVLFLLEGTGGSMQSAKENFDRNQKEFSDKVKSGFPEAKMDMISINLGTRDFSNYRAAENPFTPNVAKILLFVLPPDEDMALKLLDCGVKSGIIPFCGISRDGTYGAVFFGLKNPESEIDRLYPLATQKLSIQAKKLANEVGREIVGMEDISRFFPREYAYELRFKDIKVILPSEFCAADKNKIKVSLILRANFIVREKKSDK